MDVSKHRPKAVLDYITVLRSVFIEIVHSVPAVNKSCAIWALGLLHLICLFHFGSRTYHTAVWQRRLQNLGINPESYTFVFFQCTAVTYLKMQFNLPNSTSLSYKQAGRFYIGSTSIGMAKREFNRMAKYRLAKDGTPVHVELAVKYWSRRSDLSNFTAIPIASFSTYQEAWIFEHLLISRWQPPLNHPFITKILTLKASGWLVQYKKHSQTFPSIPQGNRLFQRLRRRLITKGVPPSIHCKQAQAWNILFELTSPGRLSFDTATTLRSGKFDDWEIYVFYRLCNHLEQPARGRARKLLASAMKFRNMTIPKLNRPATMPFLAHSDFSAQVSRFLRNHVLQYKEIAIPLHLPTSKLREAAAQTLSGFLHNYKHYEHKHPVQDPTQLTCSCSQLIAKIKHFDPSIHCFGVHQHVAVGIHELNLPSKLRIFETANASSTFFPSFAQFQNIWHEQLQYWTKYHGCPPFSHRDLQAELLRQWTAHTKELQTNPRFSFHNIKHLLQWLPPNVVIHHADHEIHRITLFCPSFYFESACRTWDDPELFSRFPGNEEDAQKLIATALTPSLQNRYRWGINTSSTLPHGFVHLKRKKMFNKGRTLISYFGSRYGKLMQATARTLDTMCVMLWPQEAGQLSVPEIWKHIHQRFFRTDDDIQFAAINDDLVGFFNSVPQSRLLDAIQQLTTEWVNQHGETQVSVNMALKGPVVHTSFVGQCKKTSSNIKTVRVQDILTIVQASLSTHVFKAVNQIWVQHRGAGIGSHISPSLSNLAVTLIERSWRNAHLTFVQSSQLQLLFTRYVDNRFILFDHRFRSALPMRVLSDCFFYQAPVELETVEDGTLLGFTIDVVQRTVRYQVPPLWKIRDLHSAGSMRLRLSGLKSRATLIRRYTFPKQFVRDDLNQLIQLYVQKGFSKTDCQRVLYRRQFKHT